MAIRVGISGWVYPHWRKVFYPKDLPQKQELAYASRHLSSIEINGSFYRYQSPETYKKWYQQVPDDFVFSVKGPQYITHIQRLKDPHPALANFFASGVLYLKEKLGAFLWQLPPSFTFKSDRLEEFFKNLPQDFSEALRLANESERFPHCYDGANLNSKQKLHHALEVRHHSFENPEFVELLRKYNIALVFADTAGRYPYLEDVTSDFVYLRLHGDEEFYKNGYEPQMLTWWANRIKSWESGGSPQDALIMNKNTMTKTPRDVFVYFDNDWKVKAPHDAQVLLTSLAKPLK